MHPWLKHSGRARWRRSRTHRPHGPQPLQAQRHAGRRLTTCIMCCCRPRERCVYFPIVAIGYKAGSGPPPPDRHTHTAQSAQANATWRERVESGRVTIVSKVSRCIPDPRSIHGSDQGGRRTPPDKTVWSYSSTIAKYNKQDWLLMNEWMNEWSLWSMYMKVQRHLGELLPAGV